MCGGGDSGGDGSDASLTTANNPAIGDYQASGVRGGRGDIGGRAGLWRTGRYNWHSWRDRIRRYVQQYAFMVWPHNRRHTL